MGRTTGRALFDKHKSSLRALSAIIGVLPDSCLERWLEKLRKKPGKTTIALRYLILKSIANQIGDNVAVFSDVYLLNNKGLSTGSNVSIHPFGYIDSKGTVTIGNNVSIAEGCSIISFNHGFDSLDEPIKYQPIHKKPIVIEDDVWIGANATILGGVTVQHGSIVAAGAVVTKDTEPYDIVAGVPAKAIGNRKNRKELS